MTRVKICGFREYASLDMAIREGVHAVGFVFHPPSPRNISLEEARRLCADIPPFVSRVGVFVHQRIEEVLEIAASVGLDTLQLHSEQYTEESIVSLRQRSTYVIIKALRVPLLDDHSLTAALQTHAHAVLFDGWHPGEYGGTGRRVTLSLTPSCSSDLSRKVILAGGITSENLAEILAYHPYGIDISSGVEKTKGVKDPFLIREFLRRFYELMPHA